MITFTITNKHRPRASVVMLVSFYGKQYRKSVGVGIPPRYWNERKKCARTTADFDGNILNDTLREWEELGGRVVKYFTDRKQSPSTQEFASKIEEFRAVPSSDRSSAEDVFFCDYFEYKYIPRYRLVRRKNTVNSYMTTLVKLRAYEAKIRRRLKFEEIDMDFYNRFQVWFYAQGFSANYFGMIVKIIKQVFREARIDGVHSYSGIEHRDFIVTRQNVDTVYLDTNELAMIRALDLPKALARDIKGPISADSFGARLALLEQARRLFLVGCYTGLRVSDFSRLNEVHIGRYISIKTAKTGTSVVIPIHPVVREIISGGFDLSETLSTQKFNDQIKDLCRMAGITEQITVNKNVGGKNVEVVLPKYKLISSHTARRSFATNAYKSGVPTIAIMKITGHTKEDTFLKYIRVSAEENAELLSRHPFFCGTEM